MEDSDAEEIMRSKVRSINNYPKPGIIFRDITPLLKDRNSFALCIDILHKKLDRRDASCIVGVESRGFIIGSALAYAMGMGFVPARKKGKLPYKKISQDYELEYGHETLEMHTDSLGKGESVLIVDDLLATGGTAAAVGKMVEKLGGKVAAYVFMIELEGLKGREKLNGNVISLLKY